MLDPEQNGTFRDAYLGVPFDLSRVLFIATANMLDTVPGPLRDRMEVVQLSGYTEEEKLVIARRDPLPRQIERNGLHQGEVELDDGVLSAIIRDYTREAGVRNLEREIGAVLRHVAVRVAEGAPKTVRINQSELAAILGPSRIRPGSGATCSDAGRRHRSGLDAGWRGHIVHRSNPNAWQR